MYLSSGEGSDASVQMSPATSRLTDPACALQQGDLHGFPTCPACAWLVFRPASADRADELQRNLAPMRARPMLDQIDRLPGSQREFILQNRYLQRGRRQQGLDMRGHVVGSFGIVCPARVLGGDAI